MPQSPKPARSRARPAQAPDFWARRMLASAVAITMLVVGVVVVWRVLGGDDETTLTRADGEWNEIALVNRTRGDVTTIAASGQRIAEFTGFTRILAVHAEGDRVALVGPNEIFLGSFGAEKPSTVASAAAATTTSTRATTTPAASNPAATGTTSPAGTAPSTTPGTNRALPADFTSVAYPRDAPVTRLPIAGRLVLAIGDPVRGGNALLVDGQSGLVIDVGEIAGQADPLLFIDTIRFDPSGNWFAIADAANFQTIVVHAVAEPTVQFFPDVPVAVDDELVVTSQVVGQRADVAFFNHDGTPRGSVSLDIPAGAVLTHDGLIVVSVDGDIWRVGNNLNIVSGLGTIDRAIGSAVQRVDPTASGTRLVVSGATFQTVIDLTGTELVSATFDPTDTIAEPQPDWSCLPIGPLDELAAVVSLDDGAELADGVGLQVTDISADGCTVLGELDRETTVVSRTGTSQFGRTRSAYLSPDGVTVIRVTSAAQIESINIDAENLSEPIDLTGLSQPNTLDVAFLNR